MDKKSVGSLHPGEMGVSLASTFEAVGVPGGYHRAAREPYNRIVKFTGTDPIPPVEEILKALPILTNSSRHQGV
jgi:hypothetical protein